MTQRILIAGFGYLGEALGRQLVAEAKAEVYGLRRQPVHEPPRGIRLIQADLITLAPGALAVHGVTDLVYAVGAKGRTVERYREAYLLGLQAAMAAVGASLRRVCLVSSTAVYRESAGGDVAEDAALHDDPALPVSQLIAAEQALRAASLEASWVLRASGIYGPGRGRQLERAQRRELARGATNPFTNRIHRDDLASACAACCRKALPPGIYNVSDDAPTRWSDFVGGLYDLVGQLEPAPGNAAIGRSNKRVLNGKLRDKGVELAYPTWREGYTALAALYV